MAVLLIMDTGLRALAEMYYNMVVNGMSTLASFAFKHA